MTRKRLPSVVAALALCLSLSTGYAAFASPRAETTVPVEAQRAAQKITISGSTSIAPLATRLAKAFVSANPGKYQFTILQGGSDVGITDVARARVTLGMSSRDPKPADPGGIVFNKFARDGVCVVTNSGNRIPNLSQKQIQDIFSGRVRFWGNVPGAQNEASQTINLYSRQPTSGTHDAFQNIFMGEDLAVARTADEQLSNGTMTNAVANDDLAIGYASLSFTKGLWAVPYQGVPCTLTTAKSGEYEGVRNFFFVTRGKASGPAKKFIDFTRKSSKAKKIIASNWVPLK